ncbi:MAG: hypothetical protein GY862_12140 [Gammaproteobacteria bacterium]|nr:hypothetical protein [Gammaproteobacteria bacterium]
MHQPELQVGGTLNPRKHLYIIRRENEDEVFHLLARGEYCNIYSSRQVGKSSLMINTALRLKEQGIRVAFMDLAGELGSPAEASVWYTGFLGKIAWTLGIETEVAAWWETQGRGTANQRLLQFFREIVFLKDESPLVIFLDEIDSTLKLPYTDDFFTAIRTMYNEHSITQFYEKVTFCLIGVASPNELVKDPRTTAYNVGKTVDLRDFDPDRDDLSSLVYATCKDPGSGKKLVHTVVDWTGGHPYLTLRLCREIVQQGLKTPGQVEQLVDSAFTSLAQLRSDIHFQQITRFLGTRVSDQLAVLRLYERILSGKKEYDEITRPHIQLKLSGLVKRNAEGLLVIRNRIYAKIFNAEWVRKSKPQQTVRRLKRFTIGISALLLLFITVFASLLFYNRFVVEPPRRLAQQLESQLNKTSNEKEARRLFEYLSGVREHPVLGKRLKGYEETAKMAYANFQKRKETRTGEDWLLALNNTADETNARKFFKILTGQQDDPNTGHRLKSFEQQALEAYKRFWERRAGQLQNRALSNEADADKALILGAAAAVKRNGALHPKILKIYASRGYARLVNTLRGGSYGPWNHVAVSPDAKLIAIANDDRIWDVSSGKTSQPAGNLAVSVAFSPDGRHLLMGGHEGRAKIWDVVSGKELLDLAGLNKTVIDVAFSPDGRSVATVFWDESPVQIRNSNTGKQLLLLDLESEGLSVAFSADGKRVVTGDGDGMVRVWDSGSGKELLKLAGHRESVLAVVYSPDGGHIATASWDNTARIWNAQTGQEQLALKHEHYVNSIDFSPDGMRVVTAGWDRSARIWDAISGRELLRITGHTDTVWDAAFSPDGEWVVTVSEDNTARIWDVTVLEEPRPKPLAENAEKIWQRWQKMLNLTLDEHDEVIDLGSAGPRKLDGWDDEACWKVLSEARRGRTKEQLRFGPGCT